MRKYLQLLSIVVLLLSSSQVMAQKVRVVTGHVYDPGKEALVGVTVAVKGSTSGGAITDENGRYMILVPNENGTVIVFSSIGFEKKEVAVGDKKVIDVTMTEKSAYLDEVVVTGYQNVNRRELASAVSQIEMDEIKLSDKFSIDQMLAGQVAGMSVTTTGGGPSATPKIRIRGTSSLYGNTAPLWVLDGIILDDNSVNWDASGNLDPLAEDAQYLVGNAIAGVNPNDIESITVLKDASATAIYGVQAANGVIVVTTKKGRNGPAQVTYNGSVSINQRENYRRLYLMDAGERVQLSKDLLDSRLSYTRKDFNLGYEMLKAQYDAKKLTRSQFDAAVTEMIDRNTDWFDLLFRNAVTQNHTLSLSGGNESTTYYSSVGASISQGTAREEVSKRYTATLKVNSWISPKVYIGFQLNGSITDNQGYHSSFNPDSYARETARTIPAYNADGSLFFYRPYESFSTSNMANQTYAFNALHESQTTGNYADLASLTGLMNFVWKIYDGLRYEMTGSYVYNATKTTTWAQEDSYYVNQLRGYVFDELEFGSSFWNESVIPQGGVLSKSEATKTTLDIRCLLYTSPSPRDCS